MWAWKSAQGSEVVDISILGPKWMRFPVQSHVILQLTTWLVLTLTVKLFLTHYLVLLLRLSGWWSATKRRKWRFVFEQNQRQKKWNNSGQRNKCKDSRLNCTLQNLLSTILSIILSSETLILQNYWHPGKPEADAALQIIICVKMHLRQKRGPKANNKDKWK